MKKKILSSIFAVALLATIGWGVNKSIKSDTSFNELTLRNIEALAQSEDNDGTGRIPGNRLVMCGERMCYECEASIIDLRCICC